MERDGEREHFQTILDQILFIKKREQAAKTRDRSDTYIFEECVDKFKHPSRLLFVWPVVLLFNCKAAVMSDTKFFFFFFFCAIEFCAP